MRSSEFGIRSSKFGIRNAESTTNAKLSVTDDHRRFFEVFIPHSALRIPHWKCSALRIPHWIHLPITSIVGLAMMKPFTGNSGVKEITLCQLWSVILIWPGPIDP